MFPSITLASCIKTPSRFISSVITLIRGNSFREMRVPFTQQKNTITKRSLTISSFFLTFFNQKAHNYPQQ